MIDRPIKTISIPATKDGLKSTIQTVKTKLIKTFQLPWKYQRQYFNINITVLAMIALLIIAVIAVFYARFQDGRQNGKNDDLISVQSDNTLGNNDSVDEDGDRKQNNIAQDKPWTQLVPGKIEGYDSELKIATFEDIISDKLIKVTYQDAPQDYLQDPTKIKYLALSINGKILVTQLLSDNETVYLVDLEDGSQNIVMILNDKLVFMTSNDVIGEQDWINYINSL